MNIAPMLVAALGWGPESNAPEPPTHSEPAPRLAQEPRYFYFMTPDRKKMVKFYEHRAEEIKSMAVNQTQIVFQGDLYDFQELR